MMLRWLGLGSLALVLLGAVLSMILVVDPTEVAVIYRFGAVVRTARAGLSFKAPWPLEQDERIAVTEVRRLELPTRRMLSGDSNLVELGLSVQYTVSDAVAYVTGVVDADHHLTSAIGMAATSRIASMDIDTLLTTARATLEQDVRVDAQAELDRLGVGVRLDAVEARELAPPSAVVDAFNDVSSARGDQETVVLAAESYGTRRIPDVRGQAAQQIETAGARATEILTEAEADAVRFRALQEEFRRTPDATRADLLDSLWAGAGDDVQVVVANPATRVVIEHGRSEATKP